LLCYNVKIVNGGDMFLSVKQAAHYLGLEPHQVYYLLNMGEIEAVKLGQLWRLVYKSVVEYGAKLAA